MQTSQAVYLCLSLLLCLASCAGKSPVEEQDRATNRSDRPNVIIIFADDQGYGDLGSFGSPSIRTPNLDRLAMNGAKLTNFYSFPSCSPSRAALLTGNYPNRVGIPNVIGPPGPQWTADKQYGLDPDATTTLPEILKEAGYATGMVGKWHLGHFPETMPRKHGFDYFYGLPYSNDMLPKQGYPDLVVLHNEDTVSVNPDQSTLTDTYYERTMNFVETNRETPFFLYLAHSMPHVPLYASEEFQDHSGRGLYADVIEQIDDGVGRLYGKLEALGLEENTLIIYTSDNGPWLSYGNHAGSSGPFREGKGTTYEGGIRVPMIAHWPAGIEAGTVDHTPTGLIDLLPTVAAITGTPVEVDTDGESILTLFKGGEMDERPLFSMNNGQVQTVRLGDWKLHIPHEYRTVEVVGNDAERGTYRYPDTGLELYDLAGDPKEVYDVSEQHPEVVAELRELIDELEGDFAENKIEPWRPE